MPRYKQHDQVMLSKECPSAHNCTFLRMLTQTELKNSPAHRCQTLKTVMTLGTLSGWSGLTDGRQYVSMPEYEWSRREAPGQYESYVDLLPGEWTKIKIEVSGVKARLFVNDSTQPVLVVNDLKHGDSKGAVALWIGLGTEGYFANLRLSK
jgi:hypothetical protein